MRSLAIADSVFHERCRINAAGRVDTPSHPERPPDAQIALDERRQIILSATVDVERPINAGIALNMGIALNERVLR
ncbi:hypothetical protein, partial [Thiolapillus sp.]|uniref:hypothetical protein n=1 Tax=Thiolapillus sp. TaxID=2017437 RepID=UPI003AF6906C